jgi:hypothetical protein
LIAAVCSSSGSSSGLTSTVSGNAGLYGYRGLSASTSTTATRSVSPIWLAASPAPCAARLVSMRSSMSACTRAEPSSEGVTSVARSRRTGSPIVVISRTLTLRATVSTDAVHARIVKTPLGKCLARW